MKSVELIISENINNAFPEYLIRIIRYIWETELEYQEATFCLEKSDVSKQGITVYADNTKVKTAVITLISPVEAKVIFRKYDDRFIMELE